MWIETFGKVTFSPMVAGASGALLVISRRGPRPKAIGRDFVDPRHRDQHQRHQQDQAERQRKGRAEHEIMSRPIGEHGGGPGADAVGGRGQHQRLHDRRPLEPQDRQRHQDADQQRDRGQLPVVLVHDRAGPGEFRLAVGVENAPIGADAAFEEFPGLIDRLDDVVVHADGFGAGHEVPQHRGLLEQAGIGVPQIVAGARPAEFGDDDALARKLVAQQLVHGDRLVDGLLVRKIFPVGQHVRGDEISGVGELGMIAPDVPDLAGCHGNIDGLLDPLDQLPPPSSSIGRRPSVRPGRWFRCRPPPR